jgi:hypothetical protein
MAINATLVGKGTTSTTTLSTASGTTAASGSTFVYLVSFDATTTASTPTDNKSNTYVQKSTTLTTGNGDRCAMWVCENGAGGSGHILSQTFTANPSAAGHLIEITGATTTPTDIALTGTDTSTPFTISTGTLAQAAEVVIALCMSNQGVSATNTYSSSNTTILSQESNGATFWTSAVSAQVVASTASFTPSFTDTAGTAAGLLIISFKQGAATATDPGWLVRNGPGVSPDTRQTFRARPLSSVTSPNVTLGLTGQSSSFAAGSLAASGSVALSGQTAAFAGGQITAVLPAVGAAVYNGPGISPDYRQLFRQRVLSSVLPATQDVTVGLSGQSASISPGSIGPSSSVPATGSIVTCSAGTVANSSALGLSGQAATSATGALSVATQAVLTGQGVASSAGAVFAASQIVVTGQPAIFSAGTVTAPGNINVTLTGQAATFATGTLVPSLQVAATGQGSTFAAGSMTPAIQLFGTGTAAAFSTGLFGATIQIPVVGQQATFSSGNVTAPNGVTASLTGQAATFATGAVTPSITVALTGQSLSSAAGTVATAKSVALTGSAISSSNGALLGSFTIGLTGQAAAFAAGLVLPPGDKTASLTGSNATFRPGTIIPIGAVLVGSERYLVQRPRKRVFTVSACSFREFPPKDPAESIPLTFDFAVDLESGVTLSGTPTVTVTMSSGVDATPANILNGLPRFDITSTQVIVPVIGGIVNCDYDIKVVVPTTDSLTILALSGILPIRA